MIPPLWSSLFMGDVLATTDVSLNVFDSALNMDTISIEKGSWWANPMVFWLWFQMQFTNCVTQPISLVSDTDPDALAIAFADDTQSFEFELASGDATWMSEVGLSAEDLPLSQSSMYLESRFKACAWLTTFPVKSYLRGETALDGTSNRSHSGKSYSTQGKTQEIRKLALQFDRRYFEGVSPRMSYFEFEKWRALWRKRWNQGRSVSFWLELPEFIATGSHLHPLQAPVGLQWGSGSGKLGKFDQLITVPDNRVWRPKRLIESSEFLDGEDTETTFHLKPKRTASDPGKMELYWIP